MNIDIVYTLMNMAAFILAGSIHEWAHAFSACIMGDSTARDNGRMNISPTSHVDILGTIIFPIFRAISGIPVIGWMKPVPVNPYNFRDASKGMALSAIAGPLSNIFQAAVTIIILKLLFIGSNILQISFLYSLFEFFSLYYIINVSLVIFNLLPIPPLDGSKVLRHGLSADGKIRFDMMSRYGGILLYVLLYLGIFRVVLGPIMNWSYSLLYLLLSMNFFYSLIPVFAISAIVLFLFRNYLGDAKKLIRYGNSIGTVFQATPLFTEQMSKIRNRNESLKKTAHQLIEKKQKGTLNTVIDNKLLDRIKSEMDSFTRLCTHRSIEPHEEKCLDCSYYANCLMRELDLSVVSEKE